MILMDAASRCHQREAWLVYHRFNKYIIFQSENDQGPAILPSPPNWDGNTSLESVNA